MADVVADVIAYLASMGDLFGDPANNLSQLTAASPWRTPRANPPDFVRDYKRYHGGERVVSFSSPYHRMMNVVETSLRDLTVVLVDYAPSTTSTAIANQICDSEAADEGRLMREILGNPFRPIEFDPSWRTTAVVNLADAIYIDRAFDRLPILADALQDAGCEHEDILAHCRGPGPHVRGCWVIDFVLGKS